MSDGKRIRVQMTLDVAEKVLAVLLVSAVREDYMISGLISRIEGALKDARKQARHSTDS